jgi:hypothetical protein
MPGSRWLRPEEDDSSGSLEEDRPDLEEQVGVVAEAMGRPLDDLDLVVDALEQAAVGWPAAMGSG